VGNSDFSDDTARDVRDEFRDLIGEGLSTEQATEKLLRSTRRSSKIPTMGRLFGWASPSPSGNADGCSSR
jgi:hypothetical protein